MTTTISDRIEESRAGLKRIKETSVRLRDCLRVRHAQLPEHLQTRLSPLVDAAPETPAKPVALAFDGSPASVLDASAAFLEVAADAGVHSDKENATMPRASRVAAAASGAAAADGGTAEAAAAASRELEAERARAHDRELELADVAGASRRVAAALDAARAEREALDAELAAARARTETPNGAPASAEAGGAALGAAVERARSDVEGLRCKLENLRATGGGATTQTAAREATDALRATRDALRADAVRAERELAELATAEREGGGGTSARRAAELEAENEAMRRQLGALRGNASAADAAARLARALDEEHTQLERDAASLRAALARRWRARVGPAPTGDARSAALRVDEMMEGGALEVLEPVRGASFKVAWLQEERFVVCASLGAALLVWGSSSVLSGAAHIFF